MVVDMESPLPLVMLMVMTMVLLTMLRCPSCVAGVALLVTGQSSALNDQDKPVRLPKKDSFYGKTDVVKGIPV
jgi:hypothetical protein